MNVTAPILLKIHDSNGKRTISLTGEGPWILGRDADCEVVIADDRASRRHARFISTKQGLVIEDLASSNGTMLDGRTIEGQAPFPRRSTLKIGDVLIQHKKPTKKPTGVAVGERSERKPPRETIGTSKATVREEGSTRAHLTPPTSRVARSTRKATNPLGNLLILFVTIGAIGFILNQLTRSPQEPPQDLTVVAVNPADSPPTSDLVIPVPAPGPEPVAALPAQETTSDENDPLIRPAANGFQPDAKFDIPFEPRIEDTVSPVGDDQRPDAQTIDTPVAGKLQLRILDDAWPPSDRIIAYQFHQKDHHGGPTFIDRRGKELKRRGAGSRKGFRVIALEVTNSTDSRQLVQLKTPLRKDLEMRFSIDPGLSLRRFLAIEDPGDQSVLVEMFDEEGEPIDAVERVLLPGRSAESAKEALAIAREREREEWVREQFRLRPISVEVQDEAGKPVAGARLLLLSRESLAVVEGITGTDGRWSSVVVPGSWTIIAQGEVVDDVDPDASTLVVTLPRLLLLQETMAEETSSIILAPRKQTVVSVANRLEKGLPIEKVWITPQPVAAAFTTERVALEVGVRGRLESSRLVPTGQFRLLLSGPPVDICVLCRTPEGEAALMRAKTGGDRDVVPILIDPDRMSRLQYSAESAFGGAADAIVDVVAVDGFRERFTLDTHQARRAWVMPGTYRLETRSFLPGGKTARLLPYRAHLSAGQKFDLEPRSPWTPRLHYERKGKTIQMRLSISDAGGRVLEKIPGNDGSLAAVDRTGKVLIQRSIGAMRWQEAETLQRVDLDKLSIQIDAPFGNSAIRGIAVAETPITVNDAGSSATGPSIFRARMKSMMPEVSRSLKGCKEHLGCADGVLRLLMDFDIFLPPGVGGLGGGGVIVLDAAVLHRYTGQGDLLPGAYIHELGHNIGFGHDPYMLLANCGVDEGIYGELGYRLLNADAFQKTIRWLLDRNSDQRSVWQPNPAVFAALRFIHGMGVHHKMFTERTASEQTLRLHGLSSIERIAALYSLALGENVAWIFRANGWPVFDDRVDLGGSSVKFTRKHPKQLNYNRLDGTVLNGWWVLGPVESSGGRTNKRNSSPEKTDTTWKPVVWPTPFTDLTAGQDPVTRTRQWLLFRRIVVNQDMEARLTVAADVKMQIRLNGSPIGFIDASPQMSQPMHDELMLNQKKPFPIQLFRGENIIEVAVSQMVGTRGFRLELMTAEGDPVPVGILDEGPQGEQLSEEIVRNDAHQPLINGDFEAEKLLDGWIPGEVDPGGSIRFEGEAENLVEGTQALKAIIRTPGAGGIIQRIVVTPGKKYRVTALVKASQFEGEALIGFFTGRLGSWSSRSAPLRRDTEWTRIKFDWMPGTSRTTYIACFVKGISGTVWFDKISLEEI
ncbi:MAG: FHA domain-containing protein [Planctomycetota bacterium]|nr:FHA domain-containing protein [Planctomycetota bacterium]